MTNQEIKELLQIFDESGVAEMEVQRGENRLRLRRALTSHELTSHSAPTAAHAHAAAPLAPTPAVAGPKGSGADPSHTLIKSPIVGTYYDAASPEAGPFVKVGDAVEPGQVLCIIESMKLMNEIEAEIAGTLVHKLVENGRPVEYGEALFAIRPR
ncbi:MAG: acetyl-CoA carboxylase biotin carboxyl carrier protein [Acidobacteriota bacterium]